ncbi:MAG: hypothetical protein ABSH41_29255 [Syntrophobacteraceae bacterium]|jgi:hypothetical protein
MATLATIGAGTYTGTLTIGPVTPPSAVFNAGIEIECSAWTDPTSSIAVAFEYSTDAGTTWAAWLTGIFQGGTLTKQGAALGTAIMGSGLPPVPSMAIRATLQITGSLITQGISLMTGM